MHPMVAGNAKERFGFPKADGSSVSHWLLSAQGDPLLNHRTSDTLPAAVDIVIIGSGMSGTLIAKHCLDTWPDKSVLVLEARQFCSGATGRNAGHCKPDQWRGFASYEKAFGSEQALQILANEQATWSAVVQYVRANSVDCDLWVGKTLDVPTTPEVARQAKADFDRFRAAGGRVDGHVQVTESPAEAAKISRIRDAQACYAWPASTLNPWKLAAHVMRDNLRRGVHLQTHTRVSQVQKDEKSERSPWLVRTDRGTVACTTVVHATNAYSSALEPSLRGLVLPQPHMCDKAVPPMAFRDSGRLQHSYGVLLPEDGLFSINPRTTSDGMVLFGGSNPGQAQLEDWLAAHPERCTDDGLTGFGPVKEAVRTFAETQLVGWSSGLVKARYDHSWSGIIGMTADGVPFVGELPGLPGQWICAGHNGHGMARIFTAAPGLVKLMAGKSWEHTGLPDIYQITPERVRRLQTKTSRL